MKFPLSPDLRNELARSIQQARRQGEAGAQQALESLAVDRAKPFDSMSLGDKSLRNRLRIRGRQVRDTRDRKTGIQEIGHLAHEVAYEHWHRMLFARFLAENGLLISPDYGVAVSLAECRELAREQGVDTWEFAGRCAEPMLPEIFGRDDPVLELSLPPETRQAFERLLGSLPEAVFTAPDSLGWTYQFWQAERKDEVNKSGKKIGADELPAVTELFTERYMVLFLLHNTIGAWRVGKLFADRPELAASAADEEGLRQLARLETGGGYDLSYLRFVRGVTADDDDGERTGPWRPAAGSFEDWPRDASALRVLDPCCGSGHFVVEAFKLLVRLRLDEEECTVEEAIHLVLRDNLFGLEIDPRCTQIAAFNVALAAWRLAGEAIELPPLNIACAGLAPSGSEDSWMQIAERVEASSGLALEHDLFGGDPSLVLGTLQEGMAALYRLFKQAPEVGSLLDPEFLGSDLFRGDFKSLRRLLNAAIEKERRLSGRDEETVAAAGMARAAEILQGQYTLVVTNVPFLARGRQGAELLRFAETHHSDAKGDIATVFVSRIFDWLGKHGTLAVVSPQNWLFLKTYRKLRERLLKRRTWNLVARLGPGAFETIGGHVVNASLTILSAGCSTPHWEMAGVDASAPWGQRQTKAVEKAELLRRSAEVAMLRQRGQLENPGNRVLLRSLGAGRALEVVASYNKGICTGDDPHFRRTFLEMPRQNAHWSFLQTSSRVDTHYAGHESLLNWVGEEGDFIEYVRARIGNNIGAWIRGADAWKNNGILVRCMGNNPTSIYTGSYFDSNTVAVVPGSDTEIVPVAVFMASQQYKQAVRVLNQKMNVGDDTFVKVPFDLDHWKRIAAEQYPNGLPEPYSNDPTQWIFHGDPCRSVIWDEESKRTAHGPPRIDTTVLQVALARLLGYRWPSEQDAVMRLAPEQRDVTDDCRTFYDFADADGIVCLSAARGESNAADRLRTILATAYGDQWSSTTERALLAAFSTKVKPPKSLEYWLRDRFFQEHCQLFHNRPFIWHIWDGRKDGFHALVNYHRLAGPDGEGRRAIESLTFAYLNDWIERQRAQQREGTPGADARLAAAIDLQEQLHRILTGEPPCDLFVRWRPLHNQAIGWEPNINDGVRLNIRPFMRAELRTGGRAGILRWKPNITWKKDRGREPEEIRPRDHFPWFWTCPGDGTTDQRTDFTASPDADFDGNRWNDLHYTNAVKEEARESRGRQCSDD